MTRDELLELHENLCTEARALMRVKNHDYTSGSGDPFANFRASKIVGVEPVTGILMRLTDKLARIRTFTETGQLKVRNEGVKDAILDILNYAVLAAGMIFEEAAVPQIVGERDEDD